MARGGRYVHCTGVKFPLHCSDCAARGVNTVTCLNAPLVRLPPWDGQCVPDAQWTPLMTSAARATQASLGRQMREEVEE